ncbi:MAG: hypothetical protein K6348_01615, partial [Deferribacterales bacterium]
PCLAGERFTIPYFPDRDLTYKSTTIKVDDISLDINISPRPIKAMSNQTLHIRFSKNKDYINPTNIVIKMNMKMDMGNFIYKPVVTNGYVNQKFIVPKCIFFDKRWFIKIEFLYNNKQYSTIVFFDVKD